MGGRSAARPEPRASCDGAAVGGEGIAWDGTRWIGGALTLFYAQYVFLNPGASVLIALNELSAKAQHLKQARSCHRLLTPMTDCRF